MKLKTLSLIFSALGMAASCTSAPEPAIPYDPDRRVLDEWLYT